jgi:hypothetical protein
MVLSFDQCACIDRFQNDLKFFYVITYYLCMYICVCVRNVNCCYFRNVYMYVCLHPSIICVYYCNLAVVMGDMNKDSDVFFGNMILT